MKTVLVAASYSWPVYAPAFADALEKNGLNVYRFAFDPYLRTPFARLQLWLGVGPHIARLNSDLRAFIQKTVPDICLVWTGLGVWPSTVRYLKRLCWATSYTNDDPFGPRGQLPFWRSFRKSIPIYDSHHVYRDINVSEYLSVGAKNVGIMRSYYVPWLHFPKNPLSPESSENTITFIGHGEPDRLKVISVLADAGLKVKVYGPSQTWTGGDFNGNISYYPGTLEPDEYRSVIHQSGILLGFLSRQNRDNYTRRYFEVPACGGFLLAERTSLVQQLYDEDQEMVLFSAPGEALEKCKYYLANIGRRKQITDSSLKRCRRSKYDLLSRSQQWLNDLIALQK